MSSRVAVAVLNSSELPEQLLNNDETEQHALELVPLPGRVSAASVRALLDSPSPPTHIVLAVRALDLVESDVETDWFCRRYPVMFVSHASLSETEKLISTCAALLAETYGDLEERQRLFVYITGAAALKPPLQRAIRTHMTTALLANWFDEHNTLNFLSGSPERLQEEMSEFQSLLKGIASQRFPS